MAKTCVRMRLLTAPSGEFWVEMAVAADSVPMSSMGRCRRQEAGDRCRRKRVCGAGRGPRRRMGGSASTIKTVCRWEEQRGRYLRVLGEDCSWCGEACQIERMCESAARVADALHARDGDRPRPDLCNALGYSFGQAHAEPCESAFDVATTLLLRTSPMTQQKLVTPSHQRKSVELTSACLSSGHLHRVLLSCILLHAI
jgi:hypothetical protein